MHVQLASLRLAGVCAVALISFAATSAFAAPISIDFTGIDFSYSSTTTDITSDGSPDDELDSVTITADGVDSTVTSDISLEFIIPDVDPIAVPVFPATSTTVSTGDTGTATLNLPGGDFVSLDLGPATVTFVDVSGIVQFAFAATLADAGSVSQSLPFGLILGDPIVFSLQANVDVASTTTGGGFVTGFNASGTGSIDGIAIPEPTTAMLGTLAIAGLGFRRRR